jgi:hypothetical protein
MEIFLDISPSDHFVGRISPHDDFQIALALVALPVRRL